MTKHINANMTQHIKAPTTCNNTKNMSNHLRSFSSDSSSQLNVLGHNSNTLAWVRILLPKKPLGWAVGGKITSRRY